ncbi:MAG: DNA/RNA non-specific endonuclease [Coprococcus sp.]|nr:DNA/RNA non-specific endonuclease [Coprococcus sp.]
MKKKKIIKSFTRLWLSFLITLFLAAGCGAKEPSGNADTRTGQAEEPAVKEGRGDVVAYPASAAYADRVPIEGLPEYAGNPYVVIDDNEPGFTKEEITEESYEFYSELDPLGRCGAAEASVGLDIMPTEERGNIGQVKPSGWHTAKYDCVEGNHLYNRCHLLGFQLTGENANEKNLITGTRYLNVEGMLPFENMVADYVKETKGHVMYRVTPIFEGENLVASGVEIEAYSVEDEGEGICFHVFCYNVQPGIEIDYKTGESKLAKKETADAGGSSKNGKVLEEYVLNTNTKKFHKKSCSSVQSMEEENREDYTGSKEELVSQGYEACKRCRP